MGTTKGRTNRLDPTSSAVPPPRFMWWWPCHPSPAIRGRPLSARHAQERCRKGTKDAARQEDHAMTDVAALLHQIDQELAADVKRQKADWAERARVARERGPRLQRYEAVAKHVIDLLRPRLAAFLERFAPVAKAEPSVRQHTRAIN